MIEIRFHGRGGQGAVTAATLLTKAAVLDGKYAQGFGAFGPERRGAPVRAFCRIDDRPVLIRSQIYNPDYVVVLDKTLLGPEVEEGLKQSSILIVNSAQKINSPYRVYNFDATSLALKILGKPIVNTAMLGFFASVTKIVSLESILKAMEDVFEGKILDLNKKLVEEAYGKNI